MAIPRRCSGRASAENACEGRANLQPASGLAQAVKARIWNSPNPERELMRSHREQTLVNAVSPEINDTFPAGVACFQQVWLVSSRCGLRESTWPFRSAARASYAAPCADYCRRILVPRLCCIAEPRFIVGDGARRSPLISSPPVSQQGVGDPAFRSDAGHH
jgi:hypothetical protein